jgi:orotate phosphoribosyltransferase
MFDSLRFSMTANAASLAAPRMLALAKGMEATQFATLGTAGIPFMQAMVLASRGAYRGLVIRNEVGQSGRRQRIDGGLDATQPVLIVDDSISSGGSIREAARFLREAGAEVAGAVTLVRFAYEPVAAAQAELRFPIRSVFDVERDFGGHVPVPPPNPSRVFGEPRWGPKAPEGLSAPALARAVMAHWLKTGRVLRPPRRLDRRYDTAGGCFVSVRQGHRLLARMGFWHFDGEPEWDAPRSIVMAAFQTAEALSSLDAGEVAVSCCGKLERTTLRQLDPSQWNIVVRSAERPHAMGGGLSSTPGVGNAWQQFAHAAYRNARLERDEPVHIWRHTLERCAEVTPVPSPRTDLTRIVRELRSGGDPQVPEGIDEVFVTAYLEGGVSCVGGKHLGLRALAQEAGVKEAFAVSFLRRTSQPVPRLGQQAVHVGREAWLLPAAAVHENWDPDELKEAAFAKAGGSGVMGVADCTTWLDDGRELRRLDGAFPEREQSREPLPKLVKRLKPLLSDFLVRCHESSEAPNTSYHPFKDELRTSLVPVWLAHQAWTKACVGFPKLAREDLRRLRKPDVGAAAFAALAYAELGQRGKARRLLREIPIAASGRIETSEALQAFAPGQVLFAMAKLNERNADAERTLRYYRRHFRRERPLDAVCSLGQAFAAWGDAQMAAEVADRVLSLQGPEGAFGSPDATTAAHLEGVIAAWRVTKEKRYLAAADAAVRFLETLVYQPRDFAVLPNPEWALGGLRLAPYRSDVRLDFVQHLLMALRALARRNGR